MDNDRIIRISTPGLIFTLSLIYHLALFMGPDHLTLVFDPIGDKWIIFLGALLSSPALGFILSHLAWFCVHPNGKYKKEVMLPITDLKEAYKTGLEKLAKSKNLRDIITATFNDNNDIADDKIENHLMAFNLIMRRVNPTEVIAFVNRRWNAFYVHWANCLSIALSIIIAFVFAIQKSGCLCDYLSNLKFSSLLFIEIITIIYFYSAIKTIRRIPVEVRTEEQMWVIDEAGDESSKNSNDSLGTGTRSQS